MVLNYRKKKREKFLQKKFPNWDQMNKVQKDRLRQEEVLRSNYLADAAIKSKINWFLKLLSECFSFPTKSHHYERLEKLEVWRRQVDEYIKTKGHIPESLYEVFSLSGSTKNPLMLWISNDGNKHEYMAENNVLKQKEKFLQFIDYVFFQRHDTWEICEKVTPTTISNQRLKINQHATVFVENTKGWGEI